jgi:hypothetical protein
LKFWLSVDVFAGYHFRPSSVATTPISVPFLFLQSPSYGLQNYLMVFFDKIFSSPRNFDLKSPYFPTSELMHDFGLLFLAVLPYGQHRGSKNRFLARLDDAFMVKNAKIWYFGPFFGTHPGRSPGQPFRQNISKIHRQAPTGCPCRFSAEMVHEILRKEPIFELQRAGLLNRKKNFFTLWRHHANKS